MRIEQMSLSQLPDIWELWNKETDSKHHLQPRLMKQISDCPDVDLNASFVAIDNQQLIGAIIVKTWKRTDLPWYQKRAWISLIVVDKNYQRQGLGSKLVQKSTTILKQEGYEIAHLGKGMDPLFCGIPSNWKSARFLEQVGFTFSEMTYDMHRHIDNYEPLPLRKKLAYEIRLATPDDFDSIDAFFTRCFSGRWQQEFKEYVEKGGQGKEFTIIRYEGDVTAFCRINDSNQSQPMYNTNFSHNFKHLYGVGPLGVDSRYRGYSLGYDVTAYTINKAVERGATDIIIDWTSHVSFYQKFGFDIWQEYKVFNLNLT